MSSPAKQKTLVSEAPVKPAKTRAEQEAGGSRTRAGETLFAPEPKAVTRARCLLVTNLVSELHLSLKDRRCEVFPSIMRVKVPRAKAPLTPDVSVVYGRSEFEEDGGGDVLLNPLVVVEVLPEAREDEGIGRKFKAYRQLASLREYLVVAEDEVFVEHWVRQKDSRWVLADKRAGDTIELVSLTCSIGVDEVYKGVFELDDAGVPTPHPRNAS